MHLTEPTSRQFEQICQLIAALELDDRELHSAQFVAATSSGRLSGFGRIRHYKSCSELCSLGVIEPQRHKGIGRLLVNRLIAKASKPLYLVCIIPGFFEPLGFRIIHEYPAEIRDKLEYCREALSVPEEYVVMRYEPQ